MELRSKFERKAATLMDKARTSRRLIFGRRFLSMAAVIAAVFAFPALLNAITLSHVEALRIGKKVWQNECNGTVAGLTSWNSGENFASLGIGHFIWYPKGVRGPFEESFPKFVAFAVERGTVLPAVLKARGECPWNSRADFNQAAQSAPMKELRAFLA